MSSEIAFRRQWMLFWVPKKKLCYNFWSICKFLPHISQFWDMLLVVVGSLFFNKKFRKFSRSSNIPSKSAVAQNCSETQKVVRKLAHYYLRTHIQGNHDVGWEEDHVNSPGSYFYGHTPYWLSTSKVSPYWLSTSIVSPYWFSTSIVKSIPLLMLTFVTVSTYGACSTSVDSAIPHQKDQEQRLHCISRPCEISKQIGIMHKWCHLRFSQNFFHTLLDADGTHWESQ